MKKVRLIAGICLLLITYAAMWFGIPHIPVQSFWVGGLIPFTATLIIVIVSYFATLIAENDQYTGSAGGGIAMGFLYAALHMIIVFTVAGVVLPYYAGTIALVSAGILGGVAIIAILLLYG